MNDSSRTTSSGELSGRAGRYATWWQRQHDTVEALAQDGPQAHIVLGICVAMGFTTLLDQTIFSMAIPRLRDGLHASAAQLQLIVSIYSVAFGVALVPAGRLGDIVGRRMLFLIGLVIFTGCSALGGLANSALAVVVARLLQGLGAGILNTQVLGLIQDLFQGAQRARALGRYASAGALSAAVGPMLGGLVLTWASHETGWRLLFLVNVPFGMAIYALAWRYLPRDRKNPRRFSLDAPGLALLSLTTVALMGATLVTRNASLPAGTWLAAAVAALALFVGWERHYQRRGGTPILARGLVRSPGYILGTAVAMCQFAAGLTLGMITTLFFLDGLDVGPTWYAVLTLPGALGMLASSAWSWRVLRRFGRAGITAAIAVHASLVALQGAVVLFLPTPAILLSWPLIGLLQGGASGLIHAPNQAMSLAEASDEEGRGLAAGFFQLSQRLACAVAISWGSGLFLARTAPGAGLAVYRPAFALALVLVLALAGCAFLAALVDTVRRRRIAARGET